MKYELKGYQEKAVNELVEYTHKLFESKYRGSKRIVYKSITASGKTVTIAAYIKEMISKAKEEVAFVLLSIGSAKLHDQTRESLCDLLFDEPNCNIYGLEEGLAKKVLGHGDTLVINWEMLNKKKDGKLINRCMRDDEDTSVIDVWKDTVKAGKKIILIIDESHKNTTSENSKKIISLINPEVTIEVTATPIKGTQPSVQDGIDGKGFNVITNTEDVIESGVIKQSFEFYHKERDGKYSETDGSMTLLQRAVDTQEALYRAYNKLPRVGIVDGEFVESDFMINPLCLIQISNGEKGEQEKFDILRTLKSRGYTCDNGTVDVWLNEQSVINKNIKEFDCNVRFLLFKQAVATGWDCPRASILVKFREVKSPIFEAQTVGRILRMPERHIYKDSFLNKAYIFTDSDIVQPEYQLEPFYREYQYLKEEFEKEVKALVFKNEKVIKNPIKLEEQRIFDIFFEKLSADARLNTQAIDYQASVLAGNIGVNTLDDINNGESVCIESESINYSNEDKVNKCREICLNERSVHLAHKEVALFFEEVRKRLSPNLTFEDFVISNEVILRSHLRASISELLNRFDDKREVIRSDFRFDDVRSIRGFEGASETRAIEYSKCAYTPHFKSRYKTENKFEDYLNSLDNVSFWIKNVDVGNGFSVSYMNEKLKNTYPDYIVKFVDGTIGIYETKHALDISGESSAKELGLLRYLNNLDRNNLYDMGRIDVSSNDVIVERLPNKLKRQ